MTTATPTQPLRRRAGKWACGFCTVGRCHVCTREWKGRPCACHTEGHTGRKRRRGE